MTNHPNRSKQQQAKHTPGPWVDMGLSGYPDGDNGEYHEIQFHNGTAEEGNRSFGHVCDVHVLAANEHARAIAKANARLIAAAPETAAERDRLKALNAELLAALKAIKEAGRMSDQPRAKYCAEIADAAIAKAEGR